MDGSPGTGSNEEGKCQQCGNDPELGWELPLCSNCRCLLAKRPIPTWLVAATLCVAIFLALAVALSPRTWTAAIAFERGKKYEAAGNYEKATTEYEKTTEKFSDSTRVCERLAVAAYRAGKYEVVADALEKLGGKEATSDQSLEEIQEVIDGMDKKFPEPNKRNN